MKIIDSAIPEVRILEPRIFSDNRGYFLETYRESGLAEVGIFEKFVQDNLSKSVSGVLRGLHYQIINPQAKLVMVTKGKVLDVAVDIRRGSPTFGKYVKHVLSDENRNVMYIPKGFAHGFQVLSEEADFLYKCSDYYNPAGERGLHYLDPSIAIEWEPGRVMVSDRDQELPFMKDIPLEDLPLFEH